MTILPMAPWHDYELLDTGDGKRLERFGPFTLVRPDPQILWKPRLPIDSWTRPDAVFEQHNNKGAWKIINETTPPEWPLHYKDITALARLTPFKHTGIFPEQSVHWNWIDERITQAHRPIRLLNLFAYTGLSTLIAAKAGAQVTHVDASRSTIAWAKENQRISHLGEKPIRWILDDALVFTKREIKRTVHYDAVILDPPIYGHGPTGQVWDFHKDITTLLDQCRQLLTPTPLFILINAYAISASAIMLENLLGDVVGNLDGTIDAGELVIPESSSSRLLSTGIFGRWSH